MPFIGNVNPIRIYQQNHHIEAAPVDSYLILISMVCSSNELTDESIDKDREIIKRLIELLLAFKIEDLHNSNMPHDSKHVFYDFEVKKVEEKPEIKISKEEEVKTSEAISTDAATNEVKTEDQTTEASQDNT